MTTTESISLVESAINDCEGELGKLDRLSANAEASRVTIEKIEGEIADLHFNRGDLEQKTRASRLTNSTSLLALERADLSTIKNQIDNQGNRVVQVERRAQTLLQQIWSALLEKRKAETEGMIQHTFDLSKVFVPVEMLASTAYCVLEIVEIGNTLFNYRTADERDLAIQDARALRERSAALIEMAYELDELDLIDIELTPVAKVKLAPSSTNVLGTMAPPVAA